MWLVTRSSLLCSPSALAGWRVLADYWPLRDSPASGERRAFYKRFHAACAAESELVTNAVYRPERAPSEIRSHFTRGRERPRGVVWFGFRSFWGHWRHFLAAAIATEDVDSRDWMTPDEPGALLA